MATDKKKVTEEMEEKEKAKKCHNISDGRWYDLGAVICMNGCDHKCNSKGKWTKLGTSDQC